MFHQVTSSWWISTGGISNAGNSTLPWWWIFPLGCAISSSVADVWRRISHCVKRRNGREEGCNLWTHGPQPRYGSGLTEKRRMCLRVMISVFFSLFFVFVVFQFQIVLLLWGIFSQTDESSCFPWAFFFLKKGDSTVAGRALQSCTWPTRLEGAKVQGRSLFSFSKFWRKVGFMFPSFI